MNSSNPTPTAEQLSAARKAKWHQDDQPLLTYEDLRGWIAANGLVLWSSRPQQLPIPAPSLVEGTLGGVNQEPTLEQTAAARSLMARLVSEGAAVPLNLLGVTGGTGTDTPDFVVSAPVFSYIFTLRGNKTWKQAPATSGAVKVSPLALAAYEILAEKVTLSAYDLTTQLGKEVTEAAVLRALTELWGQLRVLPIPQQDGSATLWELATSRFTKQIKAGANAGQPTALSALISLYLGQSIGATEEEIETFLSPLAPRSRVRDVIHALLGARQLETFVIDGKTLLHVAGELPGFVNADSESAAPGDAVVPMNQDLTTTSEDGSRIRKYTPKPGSKIGTGLRTKPAFGARGGKPAYGSRPAFGAGDRERRPFQRDANRPTADPAFNRPWDEDRKPRPERADRKQGGEGARPYKPRPSRPFGDRPSAGAGRPGQRASERPGGSGAKRSFGGDRNSGPRKTFSKPGTFGCRRAGSFEAAGDSRPPRRQFGDGSRPASDRSERPESSDRGERPAAGGFKRPGSYAPRPAFGSKPGLGAKSSSGGPRPDRGERPEGGGFARRPFTPQEGGDRPAFGRKPSFGAKTTFGRDRGESASEAGPEIPRKVFRKFDAPRSPKPFGSKPKFGAKPAFGSKPSYSSDRSDRAPYADRAEGSSRPAFGAKPGGPRAGPGKSYGDKKPSPFAGKGGPFAKFADGKKPFRKPGPGKPKTSGGGFTPTRRKRSDGGA